MLCYIPVLTKNVVRVDNLMEELIFWVFNLTEDVDLRFQETWV